jgi:hypothetical protein
MADVDKAIIMFQDTMQSIQSASSDREQRQVSVAHQGGYRGGYQGRCQNFRGGYHGYQNQGGSGHGRYNNRGGGLGRPNQRGRGRGERQGGRHVFIPRQVLESVAPEFRDFMIAGRNAAQQDVQVGHGQQDQNRNAAAAGRNPGDDGTVGATTIRRVQFEEE